MSRYTENATDHTAEITIMRTALAATRTAIGRNHDAGHYFTDALEREAVILDAAADLVECHDATGISLDEWTGPKALVHAAFELCGLEPAHLLHHALHPRLKARHADT